MEAMNQLSPTRPCRTLEKLNPSLINLVSLKPSSLGLSISIASFKYVDPSPSFWPKIHNLLVTRKSDYVDQQGVAEC